MQKIRGSQSVAPLVYAPPE